MCANLYRLHQSLSLCNVESTPPDIFKTTQLHIHIVGGDYVALEKLSFIFKYSPESRVTIVSPILREVTASFIK
jgi:precorrin-2 dehydrogenase/sirohydrochlorin ferrochelatase